MFRNLLVSSSIRRSLLFQHHQQQRQQLRQLRRQQQRAFHCSPVLLAKRKTADASISASPAQSIAEDSVVSNKRSAMSQALKSLESSFGKGAIMRMGDSESSKRLLGKHPCVSTGSLGLDTVLGIGGLARGRIVEIYGPEMSGKTTLALQVVAEAQKAGGTCVFIDAEHALDSAYARSIGVNVDDLYLSQPDSGEQALEIVDTLARSGAPDVIVVDSVAALVPRAEIEGDIGDMQIGLQARLMSHALRKLAGTIARTQTVLIFINQLRMKVGIMFGNPETTPGGTALKYYASQRLEIRRESQMKKGDVIVGNIVKVKVSKNKLAPPFRTASFELEFGKGINKYAEAIDLGVANGLVERQGAWFQYGEHKLGQGKEKAKSYLVEHPAVYDELYSRLRTAMLEAETTAVATDTEISDLEDAKDVA
ncbi:mitochondrial recombinase RecA [Andalucia godoyi]|uniref:Mitochondrial recombinase RecA n=1 Tax=Andalucia godoyi TaxID=505711 RepID=A0A8K0AHF0_ANDGO|nr:mitochondrial recombinase RecA [Andalucia godoyi]|eukprot:ANDGO_04828.mRNA.1 mitochondrial recombinase RecA